MAALLCLSCAERSGGPVAAPGRIARDVTIRYWTPRWLDDLRADEAGELEVPFFFESDAFAGAYGLTHGFSRRGGSIVYDPARAEYRQVLELLAQWRKEGLIHPSILEPERTRDLTDAIAKCGAWIAAVEVAAYLSPLRFVAAPLPRADSAAASFVGPTIPRAYTGVRIAPVGASPRSLRGDPGAHLPECPRLHLRQAADGRARPFRAGTGRAGTPGRAGNLAAG